ncbi:MAG: cache domain-containing protein [Planctomycetes bacterium]|nr:cache domain-containing protein [Planctomycetota bacterium]
MTEPQKTERRQLARWPLRVCLPSLATVALFVVVIFVIFVPTLKNSILERKREMIQRLTEPAWSVLAQYRSLEEQGLLTAAEAQAQAVGCIRQMRYGPAMKDYFWISDMQPRMVMHPHRPDLDGQDLSDFADPQGKRMFCVMADTVRKQGAGYVDYMWPRQDDDERVVSKLSFVKGFEPWGWIVGTGMYVEDVHEEIAVLTGRLIAWSSGILVAVSILSLCVVAHGVRSEQRRLDAEQALEYERRRLLSIFDSIDEPVYVSDPDTHELLYVNESFKKLWGDGTGQKCFRVIQGTESPCLFCTNDRLFGDNVGRPYVWESANKVTGRWYRCVDKAIRWPDGHMVRYQMASDITERKLVEREQRAGLLAVQKQQASIVSLALDKTIAAGEFERAVLVVTETAAETLDIERASVWLLDDDKAELRCVDLYERASKRHSAGKALAAKDYPDYFEALRAGRVVDANDAHTDPRTRGFVDSYLVPHGITSILDAAIRVSGEIAGVVCHEHVGERRTWRTGEITFAAEVADHVAQALINRERRRTEAELTRRVEELSEAKRRLEVLVSNTADREKRIVVLKEEVNDLLETLGQEPKYEAPRKIAELGLGGGVLRTE